MTPQKAPCTPSCPELPRQTTIPVNLHPEQECLNTPGFFFNLERVEQRIGNGFALCPTLRQPTTMGSEKQQFCFGNWHPVQACSWKWIWCPQPPPPAAMFYFQPPCQLPLPAAPLKGTIVPAWHSNRGGLKRKKTFSAHGMSLSRLWVHGFNVAFLKPTQTRPKSIIPVTDGNHFPA